MLVFDHDKLHHMGLQFEEGRLAVRVAVPDLISPSYFPAIAAVKLGLFEAQGLDAEIELVFPVTRTFEYLKDGRIDYVAGSAHAALYVFNDWEGCKLIAALSQGMYWFLVVRSDLDVERGDLRALRGLRIGAAPGPVDGLRRMLEVSGIDPDQDVMIGPVSGTAETGVSFGVTAAKALEEGSLDAFWANGMGAEVALRRGVGNLLLDARRSDGPPGSEDYTFPALATTDERIARDFNEVAGAATAVAEAHRVLTEDPTQATEAAMRAGFPDYESSLIAELIERDVPFYQSAIPVLKITAVNHFAHDLGIVADPNIPYEQAVAAQLSHVWTP